MCVCVFSFSFFLLVCTFKKAANSVEVKVDVQNGALEFRGKMDDRCLSFVQITASSIVIIW